MMGIGTQRHRLRAPKPRSRLGVPSPDLLGIVFRGEFNSLHHYVQHPLNVQFVYYLSQIVDK